MSERPAITVAIVAVAAAAAAAIAVAAADSTPSPIPSPAPEPSAARAVLEQARADLIDHAVEVTNRGFSPADLMGRLDADLSGVLQLEADTPEDSMEAVALAAALDASLVNQLVTGNYVHPEDVRGAGELLVPSSTDKTVRPVALYVPLSAVRSHPSPIVVMLHGSGGTESQLLATPFLRSLAEQTGTIIAAPGIRDDQLADGNGQEVYDALARLQSTLDIDRRRVYLSGYSLGGFGVFKIGPQRPQTWTALMAIAGALTNGDKSSAARALIGKQVFLIAGADDVLVKAEYVRSAVAYLSANGVDTRYYEQPHGSHELADLQPAIERAWRDMFSGVRNVAPEMELPSPRATVTKLM